MDTLTEVTVTKEKFLSIRKTTEEICASLQPEDTSIQPVEFVSPPKWHLAHTTWFFEEFVLKAHHENYTLFHEDYAYYFNSYYNNVGDRVIRSNRGLMTRPTLSEVLEYREYVNEALSIFIENGISEDISEVIEIGLQHEQQHQELLIYDIKYIFGHQPAFPKLDYKIELTEERTAQEYLQISEGVYEIGHNNEGFCFDNELGRHKVYLNDFIISNRLVTNGDFMEFIESGCYRDFNLWLAEGWDFIQNNEIEAPMYWHKVNGKWMHYTLNGFKEINKNLLVSHISFFEATAFAEWKGMRLPTEFEWEVASSKLNYGQLWEWTNSAYLPYPNFTKAEGALGEYNGKFMVNQMVLRGASIATSKNHSRCTYRNFFHPELRWLFAGIRLAK